MFQQVGPLMGMEVGKLKERIEDYDREQKVIIRILVFLEH